MENTISAAHFALCPLDGRYASIGQKLAPYFSEYALAKNRVKIEIEWLIFLLKNISDSNIISHFDKKKISKIRSIAENFSDTHFLRIKEIDAVTHHDVKAAELFIDEELSKFKMDNLISFVHIGCTSEDISNASYARMIADALNKVWIPAAEQFIATLAEIAHQYKNVSMLAHTHGQPATPTTVGKEFGVYVHRLRHALKHIQSIPTCAKWNGATGNYAAISIAFPNEDWPHLSRQFIEQYLQLTFNPVTTQIEGHDYVCHIVDGIRHFNNILRDFDLDMWLYISMEYFGQVAIQTEVGSSTMPHKVNPIRFENSEANIKMSNGICAILSDELPRSRMQRDLSDSSLQRNIGLAFGYSLQAIEQAASGLERVSIQKEKIAQDLENRWEVLAEPIQTILRKYGIPDAYNQLKDFTRGKHISQEAIQSFIQSLTILSEEDKKTLSHLTPSSYIGLANQIVDTEI